MARKVGICMLLLGMMVLSVSAGKLKVDPLNKRLVDSDGNIKIFHGVNVAYKISPYLPPNIDTFDFDNSFADADAIKLKGWGMNVVRLTIYWEAIEPIRGQYNQDYIGRIQKIVDICSRHGLYIYLDMHQDVANRHYCGEGMPDWAIRPHTAWNTKFPAPLFWVKFDYDKDGYPTKESCLKNGFGLYYGTVAVQDAYSDLWDNWNGIGDAFADMWAHLASKFKNQDAVIAYEVLNEPFIGNVYKNLSIFFKDDKVMPFYKKVHERVRQVDNETIILFEHPTSDEFFSAVHGTPGGPAYADRQVLSYHVYATASGDPKHAGIANTAADWLFHHAYKALDRENLTGFLTEFGAISGLTSPGNEHLDHVLDWADKRQQSWTYWQYKFYEDYTTAALPANCEGFFDGQGNEITAKVRVLARPYVQTSSLEIVSTKFESKTATLTVEFNKNLRSGAGPVVFYLNEVHYYAKGVECSFVGCASCQMNRVANESQHYFSFSHAGAKAGNIKVVCRPKAN